MIENPPLILTALVDPPDLQPFDDLRKRHFPLERNYLRAHITLFHKLPGEERRAIGTALGRMAGEIAAFSAMVDGLRHLGAGVCYTIDSADLRTLRAGLAKRFEPWLGPQDKQGWRPHITVQNKVAKSQADALLAELQPGFQPTRITITGLELWAYKGGPWEHVSTYPFTATA